MSNTFRFTETIEELKALEEEFKPSESYYDPLLVGRKVERFPEFLELFPDIKDFISTLSFTLRKDSDKLVTMSCKSPRITHLFHV